MSIKGLFKTKGLRGNSSVLSSEKWLLKKPFINEDLKSKLVVKTE